MTAKQPTDKTREQQLCEFSNNGPPPVNLIESVNGKPPVQNVSAMQNRPTSPPPPRPQT